MEKIYEWLVANNIKYVRYDHAPVYTVQEADKHAGHISGVAAKTLLVRGEKTKHLYLVSLEGHKKLVQKRIKEILGERVRFGEASDLERVLSVTPGSVSPLGLIFDTELEIDKYIIDREILDAEEVTWHPNDNSQTCQFDHGAMQKILSLLKHEVVVYD